MRRFRPAALVAGSCVLILTAAGCSDIASEVEAEQRDGPSPASPASPALPEDQPLASASPSASATATATAPGCPESGIDAVIGGQNAAMGHRVVTVQLWNCGDTTYRVKGYPGIELLDEEREPIDVKITHDSDHTYTGRRDDRPRQVVLAPNDTASAVLHWNNRVTEAGAPTPGLHILVTPAKGAETISLPLPIDLGTDDTLDVTSWAVERVSDR